jgi:hypothetical protein
MPQLVEVEAIVSAAVHQGVTTQGMDQDIQAPLLGMAREFGLGLSAFDAETTAAALRRGRARVRSLSLRTSRRRSVAARTPPLTPDPPSSPVSVIPSSPSAKRDGKLQLILAGADGSSAQVLLSHAATASGVSRAALALLTPASFTDALSPVRPPGFERSSDLPTPAISLDGSSTYTPATADTAQSLAPLFTAVVPPLLSTPPARAARRRKTMAGLTIARSVNYSIRRTSSRCQARCMAAPISGKVELFVCKGLGIVQDV